VTLNEAFRGINRILEWEDGRKIEAKISLLKEDFPETMIAEILGKSGGYVMMV
jgi:hypothetical protein